MKSHKKTKHRKTAFNAGNRSAKDGQVSVPRRKITRFRFWIYAGIPTLMLLLCTELVLRAIGFPCSPETLRKPVFVSHDGSTYRTRRLFVFDRQAGVHAQQFNVVKPPNTLRIAMIGGSSVYSIDAAEALVRRVELQTGRPVEFINFGFCGTGSDRVILSAREAVSFNVDAILIYTGHNEFSSHSKRSTYRVPGWLHRNLRISQLLTPAWKPEPGRLYAAAEKEQVYADFRENLVQLAELTKQREIVTVWGTMASNYKHPPVVYDSALPHEVGPFSLETYLEGARLLSNGRREQAKPLFLKAIATSPRPRRATPMINTIIREVIAENAIPLADVEQLIIDQSPFGIPGYELFGDHCHLNDRGNQILLEAFADQLLAALELRANDE